MPLAQHQRRVGSQETEFKVGEIELSHLRLIRIYLLVSSLHCLPATRNPAAPRKSQLRRVPISAHEGADIPAIPGGLLLHQDLHDRCAVSLSCCIAMTSAADLATQQ